MPGARRSRGPALPTAFHARRKRPARSYNSRSCSPAARSIALSARVAIPLPFSPVPITGQTFAVLLVGAALGRWRGAAAVLAYLAEGAAGLPVFRAGPMPDPPHCSARPADISLDSSPRRGSAGTSPSADGIGAFGARSPR